MPRARSVWPPQIVVIVEPLFATLPVDPPAQSNRWRLYPMTQGVLEQGLAEAGTSGNANKTKYAYSFGGGKADGNGKMKDVLGGKGAGLAEMTNAGLPVPPGFTIQTEAGREYMRGGLSSEVDKQMDAALAQLEALQGQKLGTGDNP